MNFNKNDRHILNYLWFYKGLSIAVMVISSLLILFGLYLIIFKGHTPADIALTGAALVVLSCGYLMFSYIKLIKKFKQVYHSEDRL